MSENHILLHQYTYQIYQHAFTLLISCLKGAFCCYKYNKYHYIITLYDNSFGFFKLILQMFDETDLSCQN